MNCKTIAPLLLLGAGAMILTGCGGRAGASGDKTETIGLTVQSIANPYFVALQRLQPFIVTLGALTYLRGLAYSPPKLTCW